jgi:hypothetical protein
MTMAAGSLLAAIVLTLLNTSKVETVPVKDTGRGFQPSGVGARA